MDANIEMMLNEELEKTLKAVSEAKTGSDEAKWELAKLDQLAKHIRENEKDAEDFAFRDRELRLKEEQAKESKKDRIIRIVTDGLAIFVPVSVSSYWMAKGLKFEQTGTFTSRTGQWLSNHLRLFRK